MKAFLILTVISASIVLLMQEVFSQEVNPDSVVNGRFYNILLSNDEWIEGEVLSSDSSFIKLRQTGGTVSKFSKLQVKSVIVPSTDDFKEYYEEKYTNKKTDVMKPRLSLSGGLGLTSLESQGSIPTSYILNLEGILFLSRNAALRLFIDCNFMGNDDNYSYSGPGYSNYEEGGNLSLYIITADLLVGSLKPEQKTRQYFTCGVGAFIFSESDRKFGYNGGGYSYNYTTPGESEVLAGAKLGYGINHNINNYVNLGGELLYAAPFQYLQIGLISIKPRISYKISGSIGLFFEPQYTFPVLWSDSYYESSGYLTVKSGITFGSF